MKRTLFLSISLLFVACGNRAERAGADGDVNADSVRAGVPEAPVGAGDSLGAGVGGGIEQVDAGAGDTDAGGGGTAGTAAAPRVGAPSAGTAGAGGSTAGASTAGASTADAGDAGDGAAILRRAASAYGNVRALRADFVMLYENALLRQKTTSRGTLYQRQPDRIALRFSDPAGDVLIGDGEHFYIYYPSLDAQQVLCTPASTGGGGGVDLQAQFVGNPVERFRYTLHGTETVAGRTAHVLTLVPRQNAEYRSLKVWLDERDSLARRFEITETNGTVRRFDLDNMVTNPSIPDATFRFVRPENARVVGC